MADPAHPIPTTATSIGFSFLSSADVRRISVKQIKNPQLFDNLNNPNPGGLYDSALGPTKRGDILSSYDCPGHFGHIDLPAAVFHPLFMTQTYNLLRASCTHCHRFLMPPALVALYTARLILLERGLVAESDELAGVSIITYRPSKRASTSEQKLEEKGDDTGETIREYKARLWKCVTTAIRRAKESQGQMPGRDNYKNAICFDRRKQLIQEFLKSAVRKNCLNCLAHHHRMRKEGHTKIIEYSLTAKQQSQDSVAGISRSNVLLVSSAPSKGNALATSDLNDAISHSDLRHNSIDDKEQGYNQEDFDSEQDNDEPEASNRRQASPASSNSDNEENRGNGEVAENIAVQMKMDKAEQAELQTDLAGVNLPSMNPEKTKSSGMKQTERIMLPEECRNHLRNLFRNEPDICSQIYAPHGPLPTLRREEMDKEDRKSGKANVNPDIFFLDVVTVPPSRFRPAATMGDMMFESPQNELLSNVLKSTFAIRDKMLALRELTQKKHAMPNGKDPSEPQGDPVRLYGQLIEALLNCQIAVNSLMDSTKNPVIVRGGKEPPQGIKQVLEKKEGLFRKNMMGKRVNYAARSVISPDINIETNEIGVPPVFAMKLTFPESVTPHNVKKLMQAVINGTKIHPGAAYIQMADGQMISLDRMSEEERYAKAQQLLTPSVNISERFSGRPDVGLSPTKTQQINIKVYRHLDDGDILIMNRQPTLHKPSMMCHIAKILRGEKTIRMHYANCNSYNADFDGDEMNMHFPQSYIAQAEARLIANTDNQYLVPTSGNPLRGLIQDHVVAGTWMSNKDTFFTRNDYFQLIYGALRPEKAGYLNSDRIITIAPAIWKPRALWTGKQIISTVLLNITPLGSKGLHMSSKAKVSAEAWGDQGKEEGTVQFYDGHMIMGTLDKSQFGATSYGLVHSCYELYGASIAGKLLGILSRLFTKYLQHRAFSCRMDDLILTTEGNQWRSEKIKQADDRGYIAALSVVGLDKEEDLQSQETRLNLNNRLETILRDDAKLAGLDAVLTGKMGELTSETVKECLPNGLFKPFPHNNMQTMTISGAKGSNVNASQISCMLGQQSLEGRRVPIMVSGKTLPSFKAFETAPRAGGYVAQRFLSGIRPQEYYFHCMAGREGLIDTAVKTSRSGYLQRCLIKHLEGIRVNYDHTVRNADQSVLQFNYGEDSLDVTKQKSLMQFEFATRNFESIIARHAPTKAAGKVDESLAREHMKATLKMIADSTLKGASPLSLPDPTLSVYSPSRFIGSVSEVYAAKLATYMADNPQKLLKGRKKDRKRWKDWEKSKENLIDSEDFRIVMAMRYMRSMVEPGEAVGLLASQGVGEPSTQMTLNTFHFAGHGAANVTLGIPRLREIVMTASANIKTPTMRLEIRSDVTSERIQDFCKEASRVTLSQIVEEVTVDERLSSKNAENAHSREKMYAVSLKFYPREEYENEFRTTAEQVLRSLDRSFIPIFDKEIDKALKTSMKGAKLSEIGKVQRSATGDQTRRTETGDDLDHGDGQGAFEDEIDVPKRSEDEELDGDADDARRANQSREVATYDDSDDEEDEDLGIPKDAEALEKAFASDEGEDGEEEQSDVDSEDIDGQAEQVERREKKLEKLEQKVKIERLEKVIAGRSKYVEKIVFDKENGEWCHLDLQFSLKEAKLLLVGIVEICCRSSIVHQVSGITRCLKAARESAAKPGDPTLCLTEGVNLIGAWSFAHDVINMNTIYSNDVAAFLGVYGVEAARSVLMKEIQGVFGVYGIAVDRRHLSLIADYMTFEGGYKPFNRTGLASSPSPFLKASFETTASFISDAALFGDYEDLSSPSASIVLGKPAMAGTGVFQVAMPMKAESWQPRL